MKKTKKNRTVLKTAFVIFFCFILFFGGSYAYLWGSLNQNQQAADKKEYKVPYNSIPVNCGILVNAPSDRKWLFYLDFTDTNCTVISCDDIKQDTKTHLGYTVDYNVTLDYDTVSGIIDRIGGIELEYEGERLRYTGIQAVDLLYMQDSDDIARDIIIAIFGAISKNGFSKSDFVYIIDSGNTDLTVPVCFDWPQYISALCRNFSFAN